MKNAYGYLLIALALPLLLWPVACSRQETRQPMSFVVQLNWLHDPTFAGEYILVGRRDMAVQVREGGPNIFPVSEVLSGRATAAVVGSDIFLQALDKDLKEKKTSQLVCFFVDFQRNPVGWVLHPDAAARAGLPEAYKGDQKKLNEWLFRQLTSGTLKLGDKRGTETTSVWLQWKKVRSVPDQVKVVPVGFDASLVLSAPMLAYPVYLNEEPFKLSEKIGRSVIVFDPAADGIHSYGNVLVTTEPYARANLGQLKELQAALRDSWLRAKADPASATKVVMSAYRGVGEPVVRQQVEKTLEFVFYGGQLPGAMNVSPSGEWDQTLRAVQQSGTVSDSLNLEQLKKHLLPPE